MSVVEYIDSILGLYDSAEWLSTLKEIKLAVELKVPVSIMTYGEKAYQAIIVLLEAGYIELIPRLHQTGRPWTIDDNGAHVWNLREVPEVEIVEELPEEIDKKDPSNWEDVKQLKPEDPRVKSLLEAGYEYTSKWKGLVELILFKKPEDKTPEPEVLVDQTVYKIEGLMTPVGVVNFKAEMGDRIFVEGVDGQIIGCLAGEDLKPGDSVGRWPLDPELDKVLNEINLKVIDTSHLEDTSPEVIEEIKKSISEDIEKLEEGDN